MDPFIGQVMLFGGNFAPRSWALCEGQLLAISSNQALFSILGTTYGGDGRTTFALPDLRGRFPTQQGTGPGLPHVALGAKGGNPTTTLTANNLPPAKVNIGANANEATSEDPSGRVMSVGTNDEVLYANSADTTMAQGTIAGANQSFSNMPPFLGMNYIICLFGTFPSRN